ncbi:MAG: peptidoglycan-binding protein [Gammaproteobacteria bacterium]|nr:peptidoglycan-binding protein [Gammaproteobacteria bacterium]
MDGAKSALDNYSEFDVDRFNAMVADYNSRCGSFRYRSGALEHARRDIEPYRIQFRAEGRSRFARGSSTGSLSAPAQPRPAPDATVQAIQRKLNELGYNAGTADGLMGRATRSAIIAFQQDRGMAATGVADQVLLRQLQQVPPRPSQPQPESRPANSSHSSTFRSTDLSGLSRQNQVSLTTDERSSIELACIIAKTQGPAAYNDCVNRQLEQLASAPRTPSMASLSYDERSAIELACITTKSEGAASYNRCLASQIRELESAPRQPSMSGLSYDEKSAIELACITTKSEGAASYNRCLASQLRELESAPRQPNMSGLSYEETSAIELACITTKSEGAANYNRCLVGQLRELHNAPRTPSLDDLSYQEKSSIQLACITEKSNGAAAYNRCLTLQLSSIRR